MGLAEAGTRLSHEETTKWAPHVRHHGILQFINLYRRHKNRRNDEFKWGDEIEYTVIKFDENSKEAKLSLRSKEILDDIDGRIEEIKSGLWTPEYGAFMIEGTPAGPFEGLDIGSVEENMRKRRRELKKFLKSDEDLMCVTSFSRMGCDNFTHPRVQPTPNEGLTKSMFFPDACIFPGHPRYKNTTTNIMGRRGEKPYCNLPIFKDKNTKIPVDDCYKYEKNALPDHVYLDSMGFGCGYSCLQATFQASNVNEARVLYDQLAPFCPILMALTAAAPFHRGYITDVDSRWNVLCNTQDCRTQEEKGLRPLNKNKFVIKKSRHDSIDCYISPEGQKYNDIEVLYHQEDYNKLVKNGVDEILAQHIAHLFIRDTISMFKEKIYQNDEEDTDHFENILSTVWQSMRLKPPPRHSSIGWRVEFRPCDVQATDFENAAVVSFLVLLTRVILKYKLNFLIPISKIDANVQRAQKRNAVQNQKFWFRKNIFQSDKCTKKIKNGERKNGFRERWNMENKNIENGSTDIWEIETIFDNDDIYSEIVDRNRYNQHLEKRRHSLKTKNERVGHKNSKNRKLSLPKLELSSLKSGLFKKGFLDNEFMEQIDDNGCAEMTMNQIINGKTDEFPGIIPLMKAYLKDSKIDSNTCDYIERYLELIGGRASGKILTPAAWMRKFVTEHPDYRSDSIVTEKINYDLLKQIQAIQDGNKHCPELLGPNTKK